MSNSPLKAENPLQHQDMSDMQPREMQMGKPGVSKDANSVPGFPQDAFMEGPMMAMDEMVDKPENFGLRPGWSGFMAGMMTFIRVLPPDKYDQIMELRKKREGNKPMKMDMPDILRASSSDHRGENENALFSPFNEAAKRVPSTKSGNVGSVGLLACDEHDVAEAVGVKLRHCSEVCGEYFTVAGLQCCDEEIHGLFGSCVDFF